VDGPNDKVADWGGQFAVVVSAPSVLRTTKELVFELKNEFLTMLLIIVGGGGGGVMGGVGVPGVGDAGVGDAGVGDGGDGDAGVGDGGDGDAGVGVPSPWVKSGIQI
jgi:hypothetical protein